MSCNRPLHCLLAFLLLSNILSAQVLETFYIGDFDLKGNVKSCLVITKYGKEEYHFDKKGRLTKSVTRYNETDYETTFYKYKDDFLSERRVENYLNNKFDRATSIANFYTLDTVPNRKITEKIVSYEKELLEQNIYEFNEEDKLIRILKIGTDGTDESILEYKTKENGEFITQRLNGILAKTKDIVLEKSNPDSLNKRTVLVENYVNGELTTKTKEIFDPEGKLLFSSSSIYDALTEKWIPQNETSYEYSAEGVLKQSKTKQRGLPSTKEYIYQFDGTAANNWVKEIITPDNTYKSRRITYYKEEDPEVSTEGKE